jgi:omega-6 fatty acid desaturase (delta-12 desaturase)
MHSGLLDALAKYSAPDLRRSLWQFGSSLAAFLCLWTLAFVSLEASYVLTMVLLIPAAICLVRLFIVQHDCSHGSFFPSRRANDVVGSLLGVLTLTPHAYWRRLHAMHHASSGNLDRRGFGDIETLTVREYLSRGRWGRARYRVYRNVFVVLLVGPAYEFYLHHRLPLHLPLSWRREWRSVLLTNVAIGLMAWAISLTIGLDRFLLVHVPITWLAGSIGVWLFYVQHQFEHTHWAPGGEWSFEAASLAGSSYLDLPPILHWCTGNIGIHHVHHLCPRIPNYRLQSSVHAHPALASASRLTIADTVKCLRMKLWDEDEKRLVGFDAVSRPHG